VYLQVVRDQSECEKLHLCQKARSEYQVNVRNKASLELFLHGNAEKVEARLEPKLPAGGNRTHLLYAIQRRRRMSGDAHTRTAEDAQNATASIGWL
jgi:hypothetical protein